MKLSIVIPVYNVENYVEQCLMSCINQDLPTIDYEIIVVNDGSTDNSLKIVEQIAARNENIIVFSQENRGLSAARNFALDKARGDYVWFVDSDDWLASNCLKMCIDKMISDELEGLVYAGIRYSDGKSYLGGEVEYDNIVMNGRELMSRHRINCAAVKTIYKREFLDLHNLRFVEGIYHEDHEFTPRAYYFINRIEFINNHLYYNRLNPNSITQAPNPKKAFDLIIVARSLYGFKKSHDMCDVENAFDYLISSAMNQSLANSIYMDKDKKRMLTKEFLDNKELLNSYWGSDNLKQRIEGLIFKLFPAHIVNIYALLNNII